MCIHLEEAFLLLVHSIVICLINNQTNEISEKNVKGSSETFLASLWVLKEYPSLYKKWLVTTYLGLYISTPRLPLQINVDSLA